MANKTVSFKIIKTLTARGFTAFWAGGCVRDNLLGVKPADYDVATSAAPGDIQKLFPKTLAVGARFGVILVQMAGSTVEVATFRADAGYRDGRHPTRVIFSSPREDALRRDFTINGMFFDPIKNKLG